MNNKKKVQRLVNSAIIAAIYAVITLCLEPISYGAIQFRISEVMVLLVVFDPLYIVGLTLGCFIANLLGPNGIVDVIFGTIATFISVYAISVTIKHIKNNMFSLLLASFWPSILNGLIIGAELNYLYKMPFVLSMIQIAAGEFVVVTVIGVPVIKMIQSKYQKLIAMNQS